jgi:hypothetical protein
MTIHECARYAALYLLWQLASNDAARKVYHQRLREHKSCKI